MRQSITVKILHSKAKLRHRIGGTQNKNLVLMHSMQFANYLVYKPCDKEVLYLADVFLKFQDYLHGVSVLAFIGTLLKTDQDNGKPNTCALS